MAITVRAVLLLYVCMSEASATPSPTPANQGNEEMVVEDIMEILRGEDRYARCPPQKILIGSRCRQILSEEELRKISLLEDYLDCVRKNVEDSGGEGPDVFQKDDELTRIRNYCMTMCMLRAEGL